MSATVAGPTTRLRPMRSYTTLRDVTPIGPPPPRKRLPPLRQPSPRRKPLNLGYHLPPKPFSRREAQGRQGPTPEEPRSVGITRPDRDPKLVDSAQLMPETH